MTTPTVTGSPRVGSGTLALILLAVAAASCGGEQIDGGRDDGMIATRELSVPAGTGAAQPSLSSTADGRVLLTWHEPDGEGHVLRLATLRDTTWSDPVTVAADRPFVVNWADFPSGVALGGERLAVHWLEQEGNDDYAYGVRIAFSEDGGRSWTAPIRPHRDSTETEHGFVSMLATEDGALEAIWLDGRNFASDVQEMTLRSARVAPDGLSAEHMIDARICDCCQTDAARTAAGTIVVYRDRSDGEIRDIAAVRRVNGTWSEPAIVHADGWEIAGCPVNGPAVAAAGDRVAVAWYTAARDAARVLVAFSSDGGATFGAPLRVDGGAPAGRVDVLLLDDARALVSWIEASGDAGELRIRTIAADGATADEPVTIAAVTGARASGFPRMARAGGDVVIAWTDVAAKRLRAARLSLD